MYIVYTEYIPAIYMFSECRQRSRQLNVFLIIAAYYSFMPRNQLVHLAIPFELLKAIDKHAGVMHMTRTEFIRQATVEKIRSYSAEALDIRQPQSILLMTDRQLDDLRSAATVERRRRMEAKRNDRRTAYQ